STKPTRAATSPRGRSRKCSRGRFAPLSSRCIDRRPSASGHLDGATSIDTDGRRVMVNDTASNDGIAGTATLSPPPTKPGLIRSIAHRLAGESPALPVEGQLARFDGATAWLNLDPVTPEGLRGRVVLVDFWTYTCINWLRTLPY